MSVERDTVCTGVAPDATPPVVLIAEDEASIAEVVEVVVEAAGYSPVVAFHGRQALALAHERWPALVITDLMMPYLNGAELIAALRAEAVATRRTVPPAILMTGAGLSYARAADADAILRKPFDLQDLRALLHRFLGDRSGHKGAAE